jgi:hypothetical protein
VASVKPSASRDTAMRINSSRGRFSAANVTTRQFVEAAYKIERSESKEDRRGSLPIGSTSTRRSLPTQWWFKRGACRRRFA